jgi:hypothetical protein
MAAVHRIHGNEHTVLAKIYGSTSRSVLSICWHMRYADICRLASWGVRGAERGPVKKPPANENVSPSFSGPHTGAGALQRASAIAQQQPMFRGDQLEGPGVVRLLRTQVEALLHPPAATGSGREPGLDAKPNGWLDRVDGMEYLNVSHPFAG